MSYGDRVLTDAIAVDMLLATHFLSATRRELRSTLGIDGSRLHRALLYLERQGILLAEYKGRLSLADRLWSCENMSKQGIGKPLNTGGGIRTFGS